MWKAARTRTVTNPSHINLLVTAIHARDNCNLSLNLLSFASFSQTTMVASYLDRLPLEIISMISDALGDDLVAHVTFSTLRPDISGFCYSDKGRDFWQPKLRASGLSLPDDEDEEFDRDDDDWWECLAFKCVEHAETCQHSKCGMARLRENERLMATMPKEVTALDLARALERSRSPHSDSDADDSRSPNLNPVVASTAWSAIAFKRSTRDQWQLITQRETWHEMAFIRADLLRVIRPWHTATVSKNILSYGEALRHFLRYLSL
ncbi:hypothetical protein BC629DRAFT_902481 [Irpex lacteus]|nr:hypothetical protein BC629DRAFT_902481 [Irpex lacteus]